MATNNRLISIDIARAICIILVVIGHYHPENSPLWYETANRIIYSFHMPLFLFASGYVYWATRKAVAYKDFVWQKFQRLMIPYFFVSVIIIVIKLFTERGLSIENSVNITAFYQMFYSPVAAYFLWFVFALFLCFLLVPFFNTNKKQTILLAVAVLLYLVPIDFPKIFCLAEFKRSLIWFVLGCNVVEWVKIKQFAGKIPVVIVMLIFTGLFAIKNYADLAAMKTLIAISLALSGIVFIAVLSRWIDRRTIVAKSTLLSVAACSYTVYLFHTTFEGFAKAMTVKFYPPI